MEKVRREKMQVREKVRKSRSGGLKSNLAKAAGEALAGQMRDEKLHAIVARSTFPSEMSKKCTPLWREAHFQVKMHKARQLRTTFGSWDVEKVRAVVVRSTFPSQKCQKTTVSDHFWKLRCRKSAHRCGAKHISKSKFSKHVSFAPLLEIEMSKKCTPLWCEAHFQVKMCKTRQLRTTFGNWDVEKVHAIVARSTFPSQKCKKPGGFEPLFGVQMLTTNNNNNNDSYNNNYNNNNNNSNNNNNNNNIYKIYNNYNNYNN